MNPSTQQGIPFLEMIIQLEMFIAVFVSFIAGILIAYRLFYRFYKRKKYMKSLKKYGKNNVEVKTFDKRGYPTMIIVTEGDTKTTKFI